MNLGTLVDGDRATTLDIDLPRLLETRMLVQANSGGGKSYLLRRLLEQTAPAVQQLVIDPEGEFSTLREKFDYIIAAPHDGDAVANPKTAALLARRLLETGVSAILDIYDLKAGERQQFVRRFLDALVNAPRKLWHPLLVVVDEAHVYCPQVGGAEASSAVIDICTRGRKRGICAVLATQRLSKLHKDAAAEMLNKLIGRTGLDVDVKRAADELGMSSSTATTTLRSMKPGEFYAFGPALTDTVQRVTVGAVTTTHPQSGHRLMTAPPQPSKRVRESLAKLADLQQAAEQEITDVESLRAEVAKLQRDLRIAERSKTGVDEAVVKERIAEAVQTARSAAPAAMPDKVYEQAAKHVAALSNLFLPKVMFNAGSQGIDLSSVEQTGLIRAAGKQAATPGLRAGAVRILQELAARLPAGYSRAQVGTLTGFSPKGGTFNTYLGDLRRGGFIEERDKLVYATEAGAVHLGGALPPTPTSHAEVMAMWRKALRKGAFEMLEAIVDAGKAGISRSDIASAVSMTKSGGTFNTYLGDLRRNGLITESGGIAHANDILFPERS